MKKRKALGLLALVLGLMAIGVTAVGAESGAKWTILENNGVTEVDAGTLNASLEIKEIENSAIALLTKISGLNVIFTCTGAQLIGAKLEGNGTITSGFKVKLTGCFTFLNGVAAFDCLPITGTNTDEIVTNPLKALLLLTLLTPGGSVLPIVRVEPVTGEKLADLTLYPGKGECPIKLNIPILGKFAVKDASLGTMAVDHLGSEGVSTEMWAISKTEEHKATICGSAWVRLSGAHLKLWWKGTPSTTKP